MKLCRGITAAIVTPFTKSEALDCRELRRHVRRTLEAGVHGIFCLGTNGEFYALSEREKYRVVETVVTKPADGSVYAGSGRLRRTVIRLTKRFRKLGADAVSIVTPYFIHPTQHELYHHYAICGGNRVSHHSPQHPMDQCETGPETVTALAAGFENIIGIKDSSGDLRLTRAYIEQTPDRFAVMGGNGGDPRHPAFGRDGSDRCHSNVIPEILVNIYQAFLEGTWKKPGCGRTGGALCGRISSRTAPG